jgi:hypothetical protein
MTKANRVHSTPPTNTSAIDDQQSTGKPHSRRSVLGAIAAATAAVTVAGARPAGAAPAVDPIYAAIERHKDLAKAFDAVWKLRAHCKDFGTLTEAEKARVRELNDATDAAGLPLEAAAMDLFNTAPTTHAGIIAALRYMRIQNGDDGEHMIQGWLEDGDGERYIDWIDAWLDTIADAATELDLAGKAVA